MIGRVFDVTKYLRILALTRTDRWNASAMLGGKLVDETRMAMGHRASPQTAQRLSFVMERYLLEALDREFPRALRGMSSRTQQVNTSWVKWRAK